jgi:hypothetical protein
MTGESSVAIVAWQKKIDASEFRSELLQLLESPAIDIRRRAQWVLKALKSAN